MTWKDIQIRYPDRWLLVEILEGHLEGHRYIPDDLDVLNTFDSSESAAEKFEILCREEVNRNILLAHGSKASLELKSPVRLPVRPRL